MHAPRALFCWEISQFCGAATVVDLHEWQGVHAVYGSTSMVKSSVVQRVGLRCSNDAEVNMKLL